MHGLNFLSQRALDLSQHPDAVYSLFYQDGLLHSCERLLATKKSGENSYATHTLNMVDSYDALKKEKIHRRDYGGVAYFTGYLVGLIYFLSEDKQRREIPKYFLFTPNEIMDFEQYLREEKNAPQLHKSAHKKALKITKGIPKGFVFSHKPFS